MGERILARVETAQGLEHEASVHRYTFTNFGWRFLSGEASRSAATEVPADKLAKPNGKTSKTAKKQPKP